MLPLRSLLNRVYALLLHDKDEKGRAEVLADLWAPEPTDEAATMARLAAFADQMPDQMTEPEGD